MKSCAVCATIVLLTGLCALRPQAVADPKEPPASADEADLYLNLVEASPVDAESVEALRAGTGREAVVDMSFLFKNDPVFLERQRQLKADVADAEVEMRDMVKQAQSIQQKLQSFSGDDDRAARDALETAADELRARIEVRRRSTQRRLLRAESDMYYASYQRISAVIADYARENGIRLVRRIRSMAEQPSDTNMDVSDSAGPTHPPIADGIVLNGTTEQLNREAVLQLINRDIVYVEDRPLDITQAILERLKSDQSTDQKPVAR